MYTYIHIWVQIYMYIYMYIYVRIYLYILPLPRVMRYANIGLFCGNKGFFCGKTGFFCGYLHISRRSVGSHGSKTLSCVHLCIVCTFVHARLYVRMNIMLCTHARTSSPEPWQQHTVSALCAPVHECVRTCTNVRMLRSHTYAHTSCYERCQQVTVTGACAPVTYTYVRRI